MSNAGTVRIDFDRIGATIGAWCLEQMAPWRPYPRTRSETFIKLQELNETQPNVFLFALRNGTSELIEKPKSARHASYEASLGRALGYHAFLARLATLYIPDLTTMLGIFVGDGALINPEVPVFAFQKEIGNPSPLLPDVDLIKPVFLSDAAYGDDLDYGVKSCSAIFAGSTTGGLVTVAAIDTGAVPRIRAGLFFRDEARVLFQLPFLAQCVSPEAEAQLRNLGFGGGHHTPWVEQFRHRFILSMDGNGPSCARIGIGLACNSVLLQYCSRHLMYYFSGLQPWLHYLPVHDDRDVLDIIDRERREPGTFQAVAQAGSDFAATFLTPDSVMRYASRLLRLYDDGLDDAEPDALPACLELLTHVAGRGDVCGTGCGSWTAGMGGEPAIEGFTVILPADAAPEDLIYRATLSDRSMTAWFKAGDFCGSRGESKPLAGFEVRLRGRTLDRFRCFYGARFSDATGIEPAPEQGMLVSPFSTRLVEMRIELRPRRRPRSPGRLPDPPPEIDADA